MLPLQNLKIRASRMHRHMRGRAHVWLNLDSTTVIMVGALATCYNIRFAQWFRFIHYFLLDNLWTGCHLRFSLRRMNRRMITSPVEPENLIWTKVQVFRGSGECCKKHLFKTSGSLIPPFPTNSSSTVVCRYRRSKRVSQDRIIRASNEFWDIWAALVMVVFSRIRDEKYQVDDQMRLASVYWKWNLTECLSKYFPSINLETVIYVAWTK